MILKCWHMNTFFLFMSTTRTLIENENIYSLLTIFSWVVWLLSLETVIGFWLREFQMLLFLNELNDGDLSHTENTNFRVAQKVTSKGWASKRREKRFTFGGRRSLTELDLSWLRLRSENVWLSVHMRVCIF